MRKRRWVLAAGAAVAAVTVGLGAVMAQSGDDAGSTSFLDRVAQRLGIDTPKLEQAIDDARSDEIDAAVADGDMTQAQADSLKERLDALPDGEFGFGFGPRFGHGFRGEFEGKFRDACGLRIKLGDDGFNIAFACPGMESVEITDALSGYLGIETAQLAGEMAADAASLAAVAEAHGKSRDDLTAFLNGELKTQIDAAVAAGDLTQARADELLANSDVSIDHMIDFPGGMRLFKGGTVGRFGHGMMLGIGIGEVREKLAQFLGIDEAQLTTELEADDGTLAGVAGAHGKSRDELKAFITTEAKAKLDEAVADGLPQEAADEILSGLSECLDDLIDGDLHMFGGRFGGGPFGDGGGPGDFGFEGRFESGGRAFGFGEAAPAPEEDATPDQQSGESAPANRS